MGRLLISVLLVISGCLLVTILLRSNEGITRFSGNYLIEPGVYIDRVVFAYLSCIVVWLSGRYWVVM